MSAQQGEENVIHYAFIAVQQHMKEIYYKSFCLKMPQHIKHIKQTYLCQLLLLLLLLGVCK